MVGGFVTLSVPSAQYIPSSPSGAKPSHTLQRHLRRWSVKTRPNLLLLSTFHLPPQSLLWSGESFWVPPFRELPCIIQVRPLGGLRYAKSTFLHKRYAYPVTQLPPWSGERWLRYAKAALYLQQKELGLNPSLASPRVYAPLRDRMLTLTESIQVVFAVESSNVQWCSFLLPQRRWRR